MEFIKDIRFMGIGGAAALLPAGGVELLGVCNSTAYQSLN